MSSSSHSFAQKRNVAEENENKKIVTEFYQKLFGDKDLSVIDKYIVEDYIQHNPYVADGRQAIKDAAGKWLSNTPKTKVDFQHVAADGDLVFLHIKSKNSEGKDMALVDIFRLKNGKIVEHWDVMQDVPATAANAHPMF
jgi:predicted SnoaL-like aldol condensation-catalyzing enzyme